MKIKFVKVHIQNIINKIAPFNIISSSYYTRGPSQIQAKHLAVHPVQVQVKNIMIRGA